jgi:hypothetical protein
MASESAPMASDVRTRFYRGMFLAAAVWNVFSAGGVLFLLGSAKYRLAAGFPGTPDPIALQLLACCLFVFGLGYYWVSCDLSRNRDLVTLGVIGKPLVFVVFFGHAIARDIPARMVVPSIVDLLFGVLFLEFLVRTRGKAQ